MALCFDPKLAETHAEAFCYAAKQTLISGVDFSSA